MCGSRGGGEGFLSLKTMSLAATPEHLNDTLDYLRVVGGTVNEIKVETVC